ncbi:MAG: hypothetical protein DWI29_01505 [Planctomycetota bacterium]|nr:MAG: hypothetical protein DWI29_01505 [Planctomycetota bacterium]
MHPLDAYLWSGRAVLPARAGRRDAAVQDVAVALKLSNEPLLVYQVACVYALTSKTVAEDKQEAMSLLANSFRANAAPEPATTRSPGTMSRATRVFDTPQRITTT